MRGPGELFVVRNVANLVPPYETGGDYHSHHRRRWNSPCRRCKVKHIVVLGPWRCGGVRAFAEDDRAALARRFHRQVDDADGARRRKRRPARRERNLDEY